MGSSRDDEDGLAVSCGGRSDELSTCGFQAAMTDAAISLTNANAAKPDHVAGVPPRVDLT